LLTILVQLVVARYLIGLLHSRTPSFFETHSPSTFSTIATPVRVYNAAKTDECSILGSPAIVRVQHRCSLTSGTFLSTLLCWVGARTLSRSGEQMYVADIYSQDDPRHILEIMADPGKSPSANISLTEDLVFIQALKRFRRIQIFANG